MSKIFFTSDNHFFHKNILNFQAVAGTRHGKDVDEMNELMVAKWNSQVSYTDVVYCLGDFSFGKPEKTEKILQRLNGRIHLIKGNHDQWLNQDTEKYFESIQDYKEIMIDNVKIVLFHYPIAEHNRIHHGSYHLYGHVHGENVFDKPGRRLDVGIDNRPQKDMGLWSWEEIKKYMESQPILTHHGKNNT